MKKMLKATKIALSTIPRPKTILAILNTYVKEEDVLYIQKLGRIEDEQESVVAQALPLRKHWSR
jgi:hypothetical protein